MKERTSRGSELILRHGIVLGLAAIALAVSAMIGYADPTLSQNADSPAVTAPVQGAYMWGDPQPVWSGEDIATDTPATPVVESVPPPPAEPASEPWATMVVREGDSFNSLAEWFGIGAKDIAAANGVGLDYIFHPGDTLAIPVPASQFSMPPEIPVYVYEEPLIEEEPVYIEPVVTVAPPPAPTPPPVARTASQADVIAAICSLPWDCNKMVRIATCESGLNPNSYNPAGYYGIFQISYSFSGWNDPWVNARIAYEQKYLPALANGGNGLSPWPHCQYY